MIATQSRVSPLIRRSGIAFTVGLTLVGCANGPSAVPGNGGSSSSNGGTGAGAIGGGGVSNGTGGTIGVAGLAGTAGTAGSSLYEGGMGGRDGGAPPDASPGDAGPDAYVLNDGGPFGIGARAAHQTCMPPASYDQPVTQLSATGCVDPKDPTKPAASLIPYEVNSALWSDGAAKQRFMAIPDGALISVKDCSRDSGACQPIASGGTTPAEGHWSLPVGSVLMKSFLFGGKLLETRLFVRFSDMWIGYSYRWNAQQTDATIVDQAGLTTNIVNSQGATQSWYFPGRNDCLQCHNAVIGDSLGTETRQLNRTITYPSGVVANQIDTLEHLGLFDAPIPRLAPLPDYTASTNSLDTRARSYLHANCAICHLPGGSYSSIDLLFGTPLSMMNICNVDPNKGDQGVTGAKRFFPGSAQKSVLLLRMQAPAGMDTGRMPPLATSVLDQNGISLISQWVNATTTCP